jgi:hypothetical protein
MKILASSVLAMEIMVMGFAVLLASKNHGAPALIWGGVIAGLLLLAAATLRIRVGWVLGSALQIHCHAVVFLRGPLYGAMDCSHLCRAKGRSCPSSLPEDRRDQGSIDRLHSGGEHRENLGISKARRR